MKDLIAAKSALVLKCLLVGLRTPEKLAIKIAAEAVDHLTYEFQYAGSGIESLFKVKSFQPDLLFVEEALVQDSDNLIGQIKKINRKAVIWVVMSADNAPAAMRYVELGAAEILIKSELESPRLQRMIISTSHRLSGEDDQSVSPFEARKMMTRLKNLANGTQSLTWLSDENGDRFLFNNKWLEFTGRTLEQEVEKKWLESVHLQDVQKLWSLYSNGLRTQSSYHAEYRLRRADKQYRLILESATPLFMADGKFIGFQGSCTDISDTRLTKHQLPPAQAQQNLSATLDHAPIAIWKLDRELVVTKANPAVGTLLTLKAESLVGKHIRDVLPAIPDAAFAPVLDKGERIQLENHPVKVESAKGMMFLDVAAWPLKDDKGKIIGVCISGTEVTRRLHQAQQREDFIATLVHDLKTPLIGADRTLDHMIEGALGTLDPNQVEVLSMLKRSNHNLLAMVQNLIEVYRYEAGETRLSREPLSLSDLIDNSIGEMSAWAAERQTTFRVKSTAGAGMILADRLAIRRVFLNLVDNALKFTKPGGRVDIAVEETDHQVYLKVADTGVGISESELPRLFSRFYQTESGRRGATGSGLGLYLCRQIVTAHGGEIEASSKLDQGTTFTITFPKES